MSVRSWAVVVGSRWGRGGGCTQKHVRPFCEETLQGHYQNVILGWLKHNSQVFSCVHIHVWVTVIRIFVKRSVQAVFLLLLLQRMQPPPGPCLHESLKYLLYASNNVKRKPFLFLVFFFCGYYSFAFFLDFGQQMWVCVVVSVFIYRFSCKQDLNLVFVVVVVSSSASSSSSGWGWGYRHILMVTFKPHVNGAYKQRQIHMYGCFYYYYYFLLFFPPPPSPYFKCEFCEHCLPCLFSFSFHCQVNLSMSLGKCADTKTILKERLMPCSKL